MTKKEKKSFFKPKCKENKTYHTTKKSAQCFKKLSVDPASDEKSSYSTTVNEKQVPITRAKAKIQEKLGKCTENEYLILNKSKLEIMCNQSFRQHIDQYSKCQGTLCIKKVEQWSISSTLKFVCDTCSYDGKPYRMYTDVGSNSRGRKASTLHRALGAALTKSPIGVSVLNEIFLTLGIDPGSKRGMQINLNKSSDLVECLAAENMPQERRKLHKYSEVNIEVDTRYNNPIKSPNTPFQGGTQAVFTVAENMTPEKKNYQHNICQ